MILVPLCTIKPFHHFIQILFILISISNILFMLIRRNYFKLDFLNLICNQL